MNELSLLTSDQIDQISIIDIHSTLLVEDAQKIPGIIKGLSQEKLLALVDLSSWNKDSFDHVNFSVWLKVIMSLQPADALYQLKRFDQQEISLFLSSVAEIEWFDADKQYDGNHFVTSDRAFIIRTKENAEETEIFNLAIELINLSYSEDMQYGRMFCMDSMNILISSVEEECYRIKNARLSEEGIPTYIDALELFSYENPTKLLKRIIKMVGDDKNKKSPPFTEYVIPEFAIVPRAYWDAFDVNKELAENLQVELSALLTSSVVINNAGTKGQKEISEVIKRSVSYFNLGMELIKENTSESPGKLLRYVQLKHIFRLGFCLLVDLKKNANNLKVAMDAVKRAELITPDEEEFLKQLTLPIPMFQKTLIDKPTQFETLEQLKDARKTLSEIAGKIVKTR
ncbi:MAG: DUF6178 family protein [Pseudomonadota bacterium]